MLGEGDVLPYCFCRAFEGASAGDLVCFIGDQ